MSKEVAVYSEQEDRPEIFALDYTDLDNERSLINIVPDKLKQKLKCEKIMNLLEHDEMALRKIVKPSVTSNRLRSSFWIEYNLAQSNKTMMKMENVYKGICSRQNFYVLIDKDATVAWMLMPVADYHIALHEAHGFGVDRLREILNMPLYKHELIKTKDGSKSKARRTSTPDIRMAQLFVKVFELLDNRVKGAVVQKIHSHNTGKMTEPEKKVLDKAGELDLSNMTQEELGELYNAGKPDVKIK